jgi:3-dehydroquinate synthase
VRVAGLPDADRARLATLLARARLPVSPPPLPLSRWLELMARDKKVEAGVLRFVLLEAIGRAFVRGDVEGSDVAAAVG